MGLVYVMSKGNTLQIVFISLAAIPRLAEVIQLKNIRSKKTTGGVASP